MFFLHLISWIAFVIQSITVTLSIAAGLFYLAELVEEYTVVAGKIIKYLNLLVAFSTLGYLCFEDLPYSLIISCNISHAVYYSICKTFPFISLTSPTFIFSIIFLFFNHYLAFGFFNEHNYTFTETLGFFTINLWLVPVSLFISLSASDNVLPLTINANLQQDNESDVVSSYFNRKTHRYGLLTFLKSAQDTILPQRVKKTF